MRALFLTHRLPYSPNRGDRIRAYHMLRTLATRMDIDLVSLVHDREEESHTADLRDMVASVTTARVSALRNLVRAAVSLPTAVPLTHAMLDAGGLKDALHRLVERRPPDLVFAYCSGMARFAMEAPLSGIPFVLDMVDVDSEKWAALALTAPRPQRWIYAREARCLARFEAAAARRAVASLVVNDREQASLVRLAPDASVRIVPNGVDVEGFRALAAPAEEPRVVFSGVMSYQPNEQAALWFTRLVWPLVRAARPDARLSLVGSNPTASVRKLSRDDASVTVTGAVADIRSYVWQSAVSVAPIATARGIQNKVLEAIAAGLPCVVTPAVFEGLPHEVRAACAVADEPQTFASEVLRLLALTGRGRRAVAARAALGALEWTASLGGLPDILEAAARAR